MDKAKYTLTIDHNYGDGTPMDANKFMARVEMVRRLLEGQFPCKQIGVCTIAFPSEKSEKAFSAINSMSDTLRSNRLKVSFSRIESLDHEFESWYEEQLNSFPRTTKQDEDSVDGQDFFEMSLEKG